MGSDEHKYQFEETVYEYITADETVKCHSRAEMMQYLSGIDIDNSAILRITDTGMSECPVSIDEDNVKDWLNSQKRHHPMLENPDPEIWGRLRRVRVLADGNELTAKDMWETFYREQIDELMSGGAVNYVAALSLMIPCMDRVYTLLHPECDRDEVPRPDTSYGWRVFEKFFPAPGFDESVYDYLNKNLRNGVIHYAFMRGAIGIDNTFSDTTYYGDGSNVFHQLMTSDGRIVLLIAVPWFWKRIKTRIDRFYEHEQWLPGWDMSRMLRLDPFSKPDRNST